MRNDVHAIYSEFGAALYDSASQEGANLRANFTEVKFIELKVGAKLAALLPHLKPGARHQAWGAACARACDRALGRVRRGPKIRVRSSVPFRTVTALIPR
jgi:hypothetical protein